MTVSYIIINGRCDYPFFYHFTVGMLSLERGTYDVIENEGTVAVCAVLTGGRVLSTNTDINILARPNTALLRS